MSARVHPDMAGITVFTDLDDTLFQTEEKSRKRAGSAPIVAAAHDRHGDPLSYHAPDQLALLALLGPCTLVPVTGRNRDALDRVRTPRFDDHLITSHGAIIYAPGGAPLASWCARVEREARQLAQPLRVLCDLLGARFAGPSTRVRVIEDAGLPVYLSMKGDAEASLPGVADIAALAAHQCPDIAWQVHHNGRNVAILPPYASKERAVAHVLESKRRSDPQTVFVGLGDSLTDLPYLKLCDFALVPKHSQIQEVLWD